MRAELRKLNRDRIAKLLSAAPITVWERSFLHAVSGGGRRGSLSKPTQKVLDELWQKYFPANADKEAE
jgi:hypothetical protein